MTSKRHLDGHIRLADKTIPSEDGMILRGLRKYAHMTYDGQADDEWCASSERYATAEFRRRLQSEPGACPWCQLSMMRATLN